MKDKRRSEPDKKEEESYDHCPLQHGTGTGVNRSRSAKTKGKGSYVKYRNVSTLADTRTPPASTTAFGTEVDPQRT